MSASYRRRTRITEEDNKNSRVPAEDKIVLVPGLMLRSGGSKKSAPSVIENKVSRGAWLDILT